MADKKISAVVALGDVKQHQMRALATTENNTSDVFCMYSVGKVFTAMLIFKLYEAGIISDLNQPIQLDSEIAGALSEEIQKRLTEVTWHQLMTHNAGIGDYALDYHKDMAQRVERKQPQISDMRELLKFVEQEVYPVNVYHYSNAGLLLLGFAIEHAYKEKFGEHLDYFDILKKYVLDPAQITSFASKMPASTASHQVKYNLNDPINAPNLIGSPAGAGSWITIDDLARFSQWIYDETVRSHSQLPDFLSKHGQEFYDDKSKTIKHEGAIPSGSSSLVISLQTGMLVAIMSNQPQVATDLKDTLISKFSEPRSSTTEILSRTGVALSQLSQPLVASHEKDQEDKKAESKKTAAVVPRHISSDSAMQVSDDSADDREREEIILARQQPGLE